jgi:predicted acylesterase/phospholipase RssA
MEALVAAGCGLKGAYQLGVLSTLIKRDGYKPNYGVGCSVGSTTLCALAHMGFTSDGIDTLIGLWGKLNGIGSIFGRNWSFPVMEDGFYNGDPLHALIVGAIKGKPATIPYDLTVCDFESGNTIYYHVPAGAIDTTMVSCGVPGIPDLAVADAVEASYSIPFVVNLFQRRFADGGTRDNCPIMRAIQQGATSVTAILGFNSSMTPWNPAGIISEVERIIDITTQTTFDDDLRQAALTNIPQRIVKPSAPTPIGILEVDHDEIEATILIGEQDV